MKVDIDRHLGKKWIRVDMDTYGRASGASDLTWYFDSCGDGGADLTMRVSRDDASAHIAGWLITKKGQIRNAARVVDNDRYRFPMRFLQRTKPVRWRVRYAAYGASGAFTGRAPDSGWYAH